MPLVHKPKAGALLTGTEYEATDAHEGTPGGELGGTWDSPTVDATHSGSTHAATQAAAEATAAAALTTHAGAADPHTVYLKESDFAGVDALVGTATGLLSGEIVVGTSPGGELGGTWASPTVDATHAGSAHHAESHALNAAAHTGAFDSVPVGTVSVYTGSGAPEGAQTATAGSIYLRTTGLVYIKGSGSGNTGWIEIVTAT